MPDLSNLLGAVYGEAPPSTGRDPEDEAHVEKEPAAADRGPAVPDWADDEHLDAAFAEWKPGPSADASPVEHVFVKDASDDPARPLADDLAAALSEALVAASGTADDSTEVSTGDASPRFDFSMPADEEGEPAEAGAGEPHGLHNLSKSGIATDELVETEQPHELGEAPKAPEASEAPEGSEVPEVEAAEPAAETVEPVIDEEPEPEPVVKSYVEESEPAEEPEPPAPPSITTQRAAAAELTAASRIEPESVVAPHVEEPEPEPALVATPPTPVTPEPTPMPKVLAGNAAVPINGAVPDNGATAPVTLPVGTHRWEPSDDDILPEKQAKKFFSFSLRRG